MIKTYQTKLEQFSEYIQNNSNNIKPFDFYSISPGIMFPEINSPVLVDYFFFISLHQFGFWTIKNNKYEKPYYGIINNKKLKGSEFMWQIIMEAYTKNKNIFNLNYLKNISYDNFKKIFNFKNNSVLPLLQEHFVLAKNYAKDMLSLNLTPNIIIEKINKTKNPVTYLINILKQISGYKEDPFLKKAYLLILILINRPEQIIDRINEKYVNPIIDYHIMRSLLRTGIICFTDKNSEEKNIKRKLITSEQEYLIRKECYSAVKNIQKKSGVSIGAIDYFFFSNRTKCPETSKPVCQNCPVNRICSKKYNLFQPIFRTTYY